MNDIAYKVKKSNTARLLVIIGLSLLMALLVGSGWRNQQAAPTPSKSVAPSLSGNSSALPDDLNISGQPLSTGGQVSSLDKALRNMGSLARTRGEASRSTTTVGDKIAPAEKTLAAKPKQEKESEPAVTGGGLGKPLTTTTQAPRK